MSDNTPAPKGSGMAVTALVLGIIALLLCLIPIINNFAFVLAILGLIFGIIGWRRAKKGKASGKGMAVAGTVLSIIAFLGVIASQAFYGAVLDEVSDSLDDAADDEQIEVTEGEAFTQHDWEAQAGWKISKDMLGDFEVTGLTVTNGSDDEHSPWLDFKLWDGDTLLASASCLGDEVEPGQTQKLDCGGTDKLPKQWDKITVEDAI